MGDTISNLAPIFPNCGIAIERIIITRTLNTNLYNIPDQMGVQEVPSSVATIVSGQQLEKSQSLKDDGAHWSMRFQVYTIQHMFSYLSWCQYWVNNQCLWFFLYFSLYRWSYSDSVPCQWKQRTATSAADLRLYYWQSHCQFHSRRNSLCFTWLTTYGQCQQTGWPSHCDQNHRGW